MDTRRAKARQGTSRGAGSSGRHGTTQAVTLPTNRRGNERERRNTRSGSLGSLSITSLSSEKRRFRPLHYYGHQQKVIELNRSYLNSKNLSTTNKNANMRSNRKMLPTGAAGQRLLSNLLGVQSDINPSHAISQLIGKNQS